MSGYACLHAAAGAASRDTLGTLSLRVLRADPASGISQRAEALQRALHMGDFAQLFIDIKMCDWEESKATAGCEQRETIDDRTGRGDPQKGHCSIRARLILTQTLVCISMSQE